MEINEEKIIEALLFVSDSPVTPGQVVEIFTGEAYEGMEMDEGKASELLEGLMAQYATNDSVFELKPINRGYQFYTKKALYPFLHHAAMLRNRKKLSRASLETISIIAYKQPVTKTEIEFIRGVNCDYAVQKLLEKNLVEITGRSDAPGRPLLYSTSSFFMEYFGMNSISDLPKLKEFKVDDEEYKAQFKVYLDENEELTDIVKGKGKDPEA